MPIETAKVLSYDTYEYKFDKMLDFLQSYKYLWIDDFKDIMRILYRISLDNNILERFDKFVENLIISDKADSNRGYASYNIHQIVYLTIFDKDVDKYIRIKLAQYFCNIDYNYCEEIDMNKISFVSNKISPNESYKNKIYKVIEEVLNIFFVQHYKKALDSIIKINSNLERNVEVFDYNPIYEFLDKRYDEIDVYSKNEVYKSVCTWKKTKLKNSNFYRKLKKDKIQKLFAMLFNYYVDEIPGSNHSEKEEFRTNYLNNYIKNFKKKNINEIITILDVFDKENINDLDVFNAGKFLINIGSLEKYGKEILKSKWNEYIFLGIIEQDENYEYIIDNEVMASKVIQAMFRQDNINSKLLQELIKYVENSRNYDLKLNLLKLIFNNPNLVNSIEYKTYLLNKIKKYNDDRIGIMGQMLYNHHSEKKIIEDYEYNEIIILLENFRYSEFNTLNEFFLNNLFEKYPDDIRILLRHKIEDNPNVNLYNSYSHINLTNCSNYSEERYNNLSFCMEILGENEYYKISNYIHYLIGEYSDELRSDILKYLNENDDYKTYSITVDLCKLLDASISCWKIYEYIISKVNLDDKLLDEIECLLFNTGVVTGEDGVANSFHNKYEFFKGLNSRNEKVKKFIKKQILRFKNLYQDEKNKIDKEKIIRETMYNLGNKKITDD